MIIKKLILATKIGLTIATLSATTAAFIAPINMYNFKTSALYVNQNGEMQKAALLDAQNQIKSTNWADIEKEINQEKIDKAKGIKIDYDYIKYKAPNWYKVSTNLENIDINLKKMNEETNRYLVPKYFSNYKLSKDLNENGMKQSIYVKNYSNLSIYATQNKEYLLNYYKNDTTSNIPVATILRNSGKAIEPSLLNQEFKDNLKFSDDFSKSMFNEENLKPEEIKKAYDYAQKMNLNQFLNNADDLNVFKTLVNHDNSTQFVNSALIELGATIFFLISILWGFTLPIIWTLDRGLLLFYILYKDIRLKMKEKKNNVNYKALKKSKNRPPSKADFVYFFKEKKYKEISKLGLIIAAMNLASYSAVSFVYQIDASFSFPIIFLSLMAPFIFTSLKKENLVKQLNKVQGKIDKLEQQTSLVSHDSNIQNTDFINSKKNDINEIETSINHKENTLNNKVLKALV
jgi:hypothetical protein